MHSCWQPPLSLLHSSLSVRDTHATRHSCGGSVRGGWVGGGGVRGGAIRREGNTERNIPEIRCRRANVLARRTARYLPLLRQLPGDERVKIKRERSSPSTETCPNCRLPPGGGLQNRKRRETLLCKENDCATLTPRRVKSLSERVRFCWPVTSAPLSGFKVAVEPPLSAFVSALLPHSRLQNVMKTFCHQVLMSRACRSSQEPP